MAELRMMATTGMVGYGYTEEALSKRTCPRRLDFIAADGGSMDPGPHYLGQGIPFVSRKSIKRDLSLIEAALEYQIPMLVVSCGGGGSDPQLNFVRDVVTEIAKEKDLHLKNGFNVGRTIS